MTSNMEAEDNYSIQIFENESQIPERFRDKIKEGEMLLKARSLTTDFLPSEWLKELAKDSYNQRLLYRHKDPESEKNRGRVYGRILETEINKFEKDGVEKEAIDTWYRIFGDWEEEKTMQKYLKKSHEKGEEIGISKGYIVNKKNGTIVRVLALEDSITHIPECPLCVTQQIIQREKTMDNDNIDKETEEIKKLREELESATLKLEDRDKAYSELEEKIKEFEKLVESKDEEKTTLEDKVVSLQDSIGKFQDSLTYLEKKPILDEIKKLEKSQNIYEESIFEFEKKWEMKKLEDRLQNLKERAKEPKIITKTLEEEREELEKNENEKAIPLEKAFRGNPTLLKIMKEQKDQGLI